MTRRAALLVWILSLAVLAAAAPDAKKPTTGELILAGARKEVENKTFYKGHGYYEIPYPGGDISPEIGVCTDLVVRAFRNAGYDIQKLLHEDRAKNPRDYPTQLWEVKRADSNIDHRRCQNLTVFFRKFARKLPDDFRGENLKQWRGGDVVFFKWEYEKYPWHVAIVSDKRTSDGFPMIVHLFPEYAQEGSIERYLPIHSHYRWEKPPKKAIQRAPLTEEQKKAQKQVVGKASIPRPE
ncbi:DUF1287 domain-containing protein [Candidatus Sumerlaeota bacterium]|nr:DUF1287 domain-containing protein [Candidatus Sumerlaeota bacterium]